MRINEYVPPPFSPHLPHPSIPTRARQRAFLPAQTSTAPAPSLYINGVVGHMAVYCVPPPALRLRRHSSTTTTAATPTPAHEPILLEAHVHRPRDPSFSSLPAPTTPSSCQAPRPDAPLPPRPPQTADWSTCSISIGRASSPASSSCDARCGHSPLSSEAAIPPIQPQWTCPSSIGAATLGDTCLPGAACGFQDAGSVAGVPSKSLSCACCRVLCFSGVSGAHALGQRCAGANAADRARSP